MAPFDPNKMQPGEAAIQLLLFSMFFVGDAFAFGVCTGTSKQTIFGLFVAFLLWSIAAVTHIRSMKKENTK